MNRAGQPRGASGYGLRPKDGRTQSKGSIRLACGICRRSSRQRQCILAAVFAALTVLPGFSYAAEVSGARIALVVGNGAYGGELGALRNPVNDARLMAQTLRGVGFAVRLVEDADEDALEDAVVAFGGDLRRSGNGGVALFYYAGHGVQSESGANYLIPVDAQVETEQHLKTRAVRATLVLEEMEEAPTALNIVVLDACRNNPFAASGRNIGGSRGLARMDTPPGSFFLAYSAAAGQIAEDGDGANSVYTGALAAAMTQPGLELEEVFKHAGRTVRTQTGGSQVPWREGSWDGAFHFVSPDVPEPAPRLAVGAPNPATEAWKQIQATADARQLERYIAAYPNSPYRTAAEFRLNELRRQPFTITPEPPSARVRLADRSVPYGPGMLLPAGDYRVEVSADGYETRMVTVRHGGSSTTHRVALRKTGPAVGDRFRDCPECPEMVVVPAGSYRMGSPPHEQGRGDDEGPVHRVTFAAPFAVGKYEVTVAEFGRFVDETGYSAGSSCVTYENGEFESRAGRGWRNPGFGQSGAHPVACVNWNDAQAYVAWLSRETGEKYRLPSESEWGYAARAGTATARYWGAGESGQCRHANGVDASAEERYSDWTTVASCKDGYVHTAPVGSFAANGWRLHDMLGNVWEWTEDCWNGSYAGAPANGSAWQYGDCAAHVLRGGSWSNSPSDLRAANRGRNSSGYRYYFVGFRVARTLAP